MSDIIEGIVRKYSGPQGDVCCLADDLIRDLNRVFDSLEREIENERRQAEAWKRFLSHETRPKSFLYRFWDSV